MIRTTLITMLLGLCAAVAIALAGPAGAGALGARTTPQGSGSNPDGTSGSPVSTIAPTISRTGTVKVGTKLTCGEGTWANDPTSYRERWRRGAKLIHVGATYTVTRADAGSTLSCFVAAHNAQGWSNTAPAGHVKVAAKTPAAKR